MNNIMGHGFSQNNRLPFQYSSGHQKVKYKSCKAFSSDFERRTVFCSTWDKPAWTEHTGYLTYISLRAPDILIKEKQVNDQRFSK